MSAELLLRERVLVEDGQFAEVVVWQLPRPAAASQHSFKYRLAFVVDGTCVLRFDNEAGKGDHRHIGSDQADYEFVSVAQLLDDFWAGIEAWRKR